MKMDMFRNIAFRSCNCNSLGIGVSALAFIASSTNTELVSVATLELSATESSELVGGSSCIDVITENLEIASLNTVTNCSNRDLIGINGAAALLVCEHVIPLEVNNTAGFSNCKLWWLGKLKEFEIKWFRWFRWAIRVNCLNVVTESVTITISWSRNQLVLISNVRS